jgi:hypothetical protein
MGVLVQDSEANDYVLPKGSGSVWIEVGNLSVWILPTHEGVTLQLYHKGHEADKPIDSAFAPWP